MLVSCNRDVPTCAPAMVNGREWQQCGPLMAGQPKLHTYNSYNPVHVFLDKEKNFFNQPNEIIPASTYKEISSLLIVLAMGSTLSL
jgi:hypothetical protein